jgi:5-methylcytosine-specific restriction endonuclease McrA
MTQDKKCQLCGESDSRLLEMHHIFGRNISSEIMLLCKNCHYKVTYEQNEITPKKRSKDASPEDLEKYTLISIGALLQGIGKTVEKSGIRLLEMAKQK